MPGFNLLTKRRERAQLSPVKGQQGLSLARSFLLFTRKEPRPRGRGLIHNRRLEASDKLSHRPSHKPENRA